MRWTSAVRPAKSPARAASSPADAVPSPARPASSPRAVWATAGALLAVASLTVACGAGPSDRPGVAVKRGDEQQAAPTTTTTAPKAPAAPQRPKSDLAWKDCAASTFTQFALGAPPAGVVVECAEFDTPIDVSGAIQGSFRTAAVRARLATTPADAAPLVVTSGSDRPSAATVAGLAAGANSALLAAHPVVGVDRRGIGGSQAVDCLPADTRRALADNAQFTTGTADPVDTMARLSQEATVACQDFLQPYQATFDAKHAADDIEALRKQWNVDSIALLGTGNGSRVALAYAAKYGRQVARLILDSPDAAGADAVTRTEQRVKGAEAAVTAFATRCTGAHCSLGADPRAAIVDLVHRAGSGQLGDLSAGALLTAISGVLADPRADQSGRVTELADALSAAGRGDRGPIGALVQQQAAVTGSDGQFVARCSDNQEPATLTRAKDLEGSWDTSYPVFGRAAAIALMRCSAWPVPDKAQLPDSFTVPTLVLGAAADPVVGGDGRASITGALTTAGATTATMNWQGYGHPVVTHSPCAQQAAVDYLKDATLPADGTACPA
ncbi:alpha/beta hydrolase [Nocardia stercoris]|uniref:Alpha/beta hydrolase n=1 Tax=Nocardia stercoris TaxID=2483361 RepID=A0A3M2KXT6_9NOCA|nr:alpha/beta hydrolase [Nocardia stercoris]RMI30061.1 alpha/beta hydrolase [Nocardia stercoris]